MDDGKPANLASIYFQGPESVRSGLSVEELGQAIQAGDGTLWLRLTTDDESQRSLLQDVFGFHSLAIEDCYSGGDERPKIDDYGDYLFILTQGVELERRQLSTKQLGLFLGPNYVVTLSASGSMPRLDHLFEQTRDNYQQLKRGPDFLTHTILDVIADELEPVVETMEERLDDLELRILGNPQRELLSDILLVKRNASRLRRSMVAQREMVNRLSRGEFDKLIGPESLIFFRDVNDHILRAEEMLDAVRDVADGSLNSYLSAVNNRTNDVMKVLAIVSVIFLPLTLLASLFGTNLDYSPFGLTLEGGFFFLAGGMLLIAGAMIAFFYRRGWF